MYRKPAHRLDCAYCGVNFQPCSSKTRHCSRSCGLKHFHTKRFATNPPWTVNAVTGCWEWTGKRDKGYGHYRIVFRYFKGYERPAGMHYDHLCRNRGCVNPDHLEIVTPRENWIRGAQARVTHCPRGHAYDSEHGYTRGAVRRCRTCDRAANARQNKRPERIEYMRRYQVEYRNRPRKTSPHLLKTQCRKGHPYSEENVFYKPNGYRGCRICRQAGRVRERAKRHAAA